MAHRSLAVSVIIPAYRSWDVLPRCLEALERQEGGVCFETLVAASGSSAVDAAVAGRFPDVHFLVSAERKFPGAARNLAARHAQGDILLFVDADCILASDAVRRAVEIHQRYAHPLIGGVIGHDPSGGYIAWGYYFSGLTPWMPRREPEPIPVSDVATGCCSIKRWAFEQYGPFSEERFCEDTLLSWNIARAGFPLLLDPGLRVCHHGFDTLLLQWRRKFKHGQVLSVSRANELRWSWTRRWLQIAAFPVIPPLLLYRAGRAVFKAGCYRKPFLLTLPATFTALCAWAAGETWGLLFSEQLENSDGQPL